MLGESFSPAPGISSGQEREEPSLCPAEWHGHEGQRCWALPPGAAGSAGEQRSVCAPPALLWPSWQRPTSSQASHGFREGHLPLPQWHLSALANLVPSFPTPFPETEKCLERSDSFIPPRFSITVTSTLLRVKTWHSLRAKSRSPRAPGQAPAPD